MNIASSLSNIAEKKHADIGLIEAKTGKKYSFGYLEKRSNQYAWYLRKCGVFPGNRVMLMVRPSADFICLTFGLFKLGAPVILIDPGMGYKNLLKCITGVRPDSFIGVPKAHVFLKLFRKQFSTVKKAFCVGRSFGLFGPDITRGIDMRSEKYPAFEPKSDDLAAIIFTTGSTGPPKGVRYEHDIFSAQLEHIRTYYQIGEGDVDQPAFPLFALFSTALGACAVIPDMDPTKPAEVNPKTYIASIKRYGVTYSFGSPALWNVVSNYCSSNSIILPTVKKVLMAGAPVPGKLIERMYSILPEDAKVHTPYGATECLPVISIEGREIVNETWKETQKGKGTCVGRPLPGIKLMIIAVSDNAIDQFTEDMILAEGEIGEVLVSGNVVTREYENNSVETELSKVFYKDRLWHRIGDTGYLDDKGRLWFCGRKAHRVQTENGVKYTIPCEAIINKHNDVFRSALVGVRSNGSFAEAAIIVELEKSCRRKHEDVLDEVKKLAAASPLTVDIRYFLVHSSFPVDIRHNAKIFREKLSTWADQKLEEG